MCVSNRKKRILFEFGNSQFKIQRSSSLIFWHFYPELQWFPLSGNTPWENLCKLTSIWGWLNDIRCKMLSVKIITKSKERRGNRNCLSQAWFGSSLICLKLANLSCQKCPLSSTNRITFWTRLNVVSNRPKYISVKLRQLLLNENHMITILYSTIF